MEKFSNALEILFTGFLGSLVSLLFNTDTITWKRKVILVVSGTACSYFATPLIIYYYHLDAKLLGSIVFLVGLFGMIVVGQIMKAIPTLVQAFAERLSGNRS